MEYENRSFFCAAVLATSVMLAAPAAALAGPKDWESPDAIVSALYEVISADAGGKRDWERYRALFLDGARMSIAMKSRVANGIMGIGPEDLIAQTEAAYASTGFHEIPLVTRVEQHGLMASVMSSFEVRLRSNDPKPLMRGLNHFQLLNDGDRWWIVSNIGIIETDAVALPKAYRPAGETESTP